jgi:hypothetical protein
VRGFEGKGRHLGNFDGGGTRRSKSNKKQCCSARVDAMTSWVVALFAARKIVCWLAWCSGGTRSNSCRCSGVRSSREARSGRGGGRVLGNRVVGGLVGQGLCEGGRGGGNEVYTTPGSPGPSQVRLGLGLGESRFWGRMLGSCSRINCLSTGAIGLFWCETEDSWGGDTSLGWQNC